VRKCWEDTEKMTFRCWELWDDESVSGPSLVRTVLEARLGLGCES
jgi:hypothetical protein